MGEPEIELEAAVACEAAADFFAASDPEAAELRNGFVASGWPDSRAVGQRFSGGGIYPLAAANRARTAGLVLGAWAGPKYGGFVHPSFQFRTDGTVHPLLPSILKSLASIPGLSSAVDPSGWGRVFWLYQSRGALSQRSLAVRATSCDMVCEDAEKFLRIPGNARSPAEVFAKHPQAVMALAKADSRACRGVLCAK